MHVTAAVSNCTAGPQYHQVTHHQVTNHQVTNHQSSSLCAAVKICMVRTAYLVSGRDTPF